MNGISITTTIVTEKNITTTTNHHKISTAPYDYILNLELEKYIVFMIFIAMGLFVMNCVIYDHDINNIHTTIIIFILVITIIQTIAIQTQLLSQSNTTIYTNQQQFKQLNGFNHNQTQLLSPSITQIHKINHDHYNVNKQGLPQQSDRSFTLHQPGVPILRPTTLPFDKSQLQDFHLLVQIVQYLVFKVLLLIQLSQQLFIQLSCYFFVFLVASVTCVGGVCGTENLFAC